MTATPRAAQAPDRENQGTVKKENPGPDLDSLVLSIDNLTYYTKTRQAAGFAGAAAWGLGAVP